MADNRTYYYMRVKEDFYETDEMKILQAMDNGYLYSDILMKLYLKSLKNDGRLMFKVNIPYNPKMISTITGHNIDIVTKALSIFKELGLIDVLDNGAIYMLDIQNFIGKTSTESDRKREYRKRIDSEKNMLSTGKGQMSGQCPLEIEIKKDIDINKKEIDKEKSKSASADRKVKKFIPPTVEEVKAYCDERNNTVDPNSFIDFYESKGWLIGKNKMKDWKAAVRTWERSRNNNTSTNQKNNTFRAHI